MCCATLDLPFELCGMENPNFKNRRLEVLLHGIPVGRISEMQGGGTAFHFQSGYPGLVPRAILGQKFENDLERTAYRSRQKERLPDFFANLIPEGALRDLIQRLSAIEPNDHLSLLSLVGEDLPGAVVVRPIDHQAKLQQLPRFLRFSLAGVQLKLSMLREGEKLTAPVQNQAGDWIAKFDSPSFSHLPENEYSILQWARAAGFDVPECHLHELDDLDPENEFLGVVRRIVAEETRVLAVRRYDRTSKGRVHQEDFAQAVGLPPAKKYEQIRHEDMAVLVRQFMGEKSVDEYVRRLVLMVATGNGDAHLKNWSLIYPDRIQPAWSPLYDQVATVAWRAPARELSLKLGEVKSFAGLDRRTFDRFADRAEIDRSKLEGLIDETLDRLRDAWKGLRNELPLVPEHRQAIEEHWRQVPLLKSAGGFG